MTELIHLLIKAFRHLADLASGQFYVTKAGIYPLCSILGTIRYIAPNNGNGYPHARFALAQLLVIHLGLHELHIELFQHYTA